jgi:hypothetical protein
VPARTSRRATTCSSSSTPRSATSGSRRTKDLWQTLEALAKYGRRDPLAQDEAQTLLNQLKTWYFETGGLVLSRDARQDYFALLDGLEVVIRLSGDTLSAADDEFLRVLGSRLRTAMTRDVGTRRTFVFRGDPEREEPRLGSRTYVEAGTARELALLPRPRLRLARRFGRPWRALETVEPELRLTDADKPGRWDLARQALTVRVCGPEGTAEERLFLFEDGQIVEGPKGWQRSDDVMRRPSVIWRERKRPAKHGE